MPADGKGQNLQSFRSAYDPFSGRSPYNHLYIRSMVFPDKKRFEVFVSEFGRSGESASVRQVRLAIRDRLAARFGAAVHSQS